MLKFLIVMTLIALPAQARADANHNVKGDVIGGIIHSRMIMKPWKPAPKPTKNDKMDEGDIATQLSIRDTADINKAIAQL